jgi:hypothetical protein
MTLIAAFHATRTDEKIGPKGIAICADSQETVKYPDEYGNMEEYRQAVLKIDPIHRGRIHVAIAGGGNATLIETFIERARRALAAAPDVATLRGAKAILEGELDRFYRNDIAICPDSDKQVQLFVAVSCPETKEYDLWVSEYAVLRTPTFPALIGWVHEMYSQTAARLSSAEMTLPQAVLASIYTLTLAKQTSNYVGGDLSVVVIRPTGIWVESGSYITEMENRLKAYEAKVNQVFLSCSDTSVGVNSLDKQLKEFSGEVVSLHRNHIEKLVRGLTLEQMAQTNDAYPKYPLGSSVVYDMQGNFLQIADPEQKQDMDLYAKAAYEQFLKRGLVEYVVRRLSADRFLVLSSGRFTTGKDEPLGELTRDQLAIAMANSQPFTANAILAFLAEDNSEIVVYGDPMPSTSQT